MSDSRTRDDDGEFFVGYRPMPARLRRFTVRAAAGAVLSLVVMGAVLSATHESPGAKLEEERPGHRVDGVLVADPYPHLRYFGEDGEVRSMLLAGVGKNGASFPGADGRRRLRGLLFERAGTRLLDDAAVADTAAELGEVDERTLLEAPSEVLGDVTLTGEIVDSKCFFGRMRPGRGRVHRACAQYCIAGGVTPVLVTWDGDEVETYYVLTTVEEAPVGQQVLPWVAEPVAVEGELIRRAGLNYLRIDPARIRRL